MTASLAIVARRAVRAGWIAPLLFALLAPAAARAEPYLAVRSGLKCMACHVNPGGGGKRTEFGAAYGQTALASERLDPATGDAVPPSAAGPAMWTGKLNDQVGLGSDLRATLQSVKVPGSKETLAFDPTRAQIYVEVKLLGERLSLYLDERVAPGAATNRETYALLWFADRRAYVKAGRMYIPFGLRVEDDTAFIRQVSGVNFNSSDDGVEGGLEVGPWSAAVSVTNGAGGGAETNRSKLISSAATYVHPDWRLGLSASVNRNGGADRRMQSVFGGLRLGIVSALASAVYITDDGTPIGRVRHWASLAEANIEAAKGHNIKLTYESYDPNVDVREDQRVRYSVVWEFVPFQFTQFRLGARKGSGIPQNNAQNASDVFLQWHAFF
jgi:hypothetical protein